MSDKSAIYRAVCEMHTAQEKLIQFLSSLSKKYYMKDIPVWEVRHILTLSSAVITACDNYNSFYWSSTYGGIVVNEDGILKYRH